MRLLRKESDIVHERRGRKMPLTAAAGNLDDEEDILAPKPDSGGGLA
jgi:hypothetical protein